MIQLLEAIEEREPPKGKTAGNVSRLPKRSTRAAHSIVDITDRELFSKRGLIDIGTKKKAPIIKKERKRALKRRNEMVQSSSRVKNTKRKKVAAATTANIPTPNEGPLNEEHGNASQQANVFPPKMGDRLDTTRQFQEVAAATTANVPTPNEGPLNEEHGNASQQANVFQTKKGDRLPTTSQFDELIKISRELLARVVSIDENKKTKTTPHHSGKGSHEAGQPYVVEDPSIDLQFADRDIYGNQMMVDKDAVQPDDFESSVPEPQDREKGTCTSAQTQECKRKAQKKAPTTVSAILDSSNVLANHVVEFELLTNQDIARFETTESSRVSRRQQLQYGVSEGPYPLRVAWPQTISAFEAWYTNAAKTPQSKPLKGMPYVGDRHASWFEELWKARGWLSSDHIDCLVHLNIAAFKRNPTAFLTKWTVVEQIGWNALCAVTEDVLRSQLKPYIEGRAPYQLATPWWEAEKVVGLAQLQKEHWVCYEINIDEQCVIIYDSLSSSRDPLLVRKPFARVLINLAWMCQECKLWERRFKKKSLHQVWELKIENHLPQQGNTTNSGIMALKYFECLITNTPMSVLHEDHGEEFRRSYCAQLFDHCRQDLLG
ncbi:uncharacterized protein LOC131004043 [Salvia miltiorrhiza]|uniref:uncharacterized protein LOC131004043 n=1 Tax=Salvia miltiorrhiza TaxID=226208 RepID=UPI0025ACAC62|nr:uncharacterized protein LOC131004043 [Salvia miltiorrhiza]